MADGAAALKGDTVREETALTVRPPGLPPSRTGSAGTLLSADDVLYANEISRGRVWVWLCAGIAVAGLIASLAVTAPRTSRGLLAVGCLVLLGAVFVALWVLRDERRYTRGLAQLFSYVCVACMLPAYYFCGWFSAVTLLVPLGGITFSLGQERRAVLGIAIATCGSHAVFALLTIFGVIEDRSVFAVQTASTTDQLLLVLFVQFICVCSFLIGRQLRGHALDAVGRYGDAVREGARREALLEEALQDLAVARQAGQAGRFTGHTIGGYRLGAIIGRGAMGEVYEGDRGGAAAAVKVMVDVPSQHAVERFDREIRIAAALVSPHLARVLGHSAPGDAVKYLAMERLVGASLAEHLRGGAMPVRDAIAMLEQVASAVDVAHAAGIVHRDLKPSNLFRHDGGGPSVWKVLDFGVSKLADSEGTLTAGAIVGTPAYMAPEQASGHDVTPRADLFALGAIAYRVLVGRPAYGGRDIAAVLYAVVHTMPPRPSTIAAVPRDLDRALAIALAKDPEHRFATARELVEAIAAAARADLPIELRRHGEAMIALHPWGAAD
jgi:hypothetical protein